MKQLAHSERLKQAHVRITRSKQFALLVGLLMMGKTEVKELAMPTAGTDGLNCYYDPRFLDKINDKELAFTVIHEKFHVMLKHTTTWKALHKQNAQLCNMACDYVINGMIDNMDKDNEVMELPRKEIIEVCLDHKYDGWDTQAVFKDLLKNPPPPQEGGAGQPGDGYGDGDPTGGFDAHDWEAAGEWSDEKVEELGKVIDQAVRQASILAGKVGGKTGRDVGAIPPPKIDWRAQLRNFVNEVTAGKDISTWARPNRRFIGQGLYLPTTYSETVGEIVVGVDTSGSIGEHELREFLAEVKGICDAVKPAKLTLMYWDTAVAATEEYEDEDYEGLLSSTKPAGGGGTDAMCVKYAVSQMRKQPVAVIMLTDGYLGGDFPVFNQPALWCITSDVKATSGTTLKIGE